MTCSNIIARHCARLGCNELSIVIVVLDRFPECVNFLWRLFIVMTQVVVGPTGKETDAVKVLANVHVPVVADVLGYGFLKKRTP